MASPTASPIGVACETATESSVAVSAASHSTGAHTRRSTHSPHTWMGSVVKVSGQK